MMGWLSVLAFLVVFVGGAVLYGAIEHKVTSRPAPRRARREGAAFFRRCPRPSAPSAEKWARVALGGSVRFNDRTIQRIKERNR